MRFKNRIWTSDEYLIKYKMLNSPQAVTEYSAEGVTMIKCDGELVTTYEEKHKLEADGRDAHKWEIMRLPIYYFKFIQTKDGVIMCEASEAKQFFKKGVQGCKKGHKII